MASSFIEGLQINVWRLAKADVASRTGIETHDDTAYAVLGNNAYVSALTAYRYKGAADSRRDQEGIGACIDRFTADTTRAVIDTDRFGAELDAMETEWRKKLGRVRAESSVDLLLRVLPSAPVLTVATAADLIGRSTQRANDAVNQLTAAGVLKQTTIGRRNRAFEVPDLISALTGFERALASPPG
ncbi:hypothetical protein ACIBK1_01010 [Microbispora rosea]|uniref:hypothetical protein n=1 Tax=Microbispora rosea TaxID=58117 RepID=UPI0037B8F80B